MNRDALVAELVDAQDLKSCLPQGEYGFNSRLGHKSVDSASEQRTVFTDFSVFWHCFCYYRRLKSPTDAFVSSLFFFDTREAM